MADLLAARLRNGASSATLRAEFNKRDTQLVELYRCGPYRLKALFLCGERSYWTVESAADRTRSWTQDALDAWLYADIVKQLDVRLSAIAGAIGR